MLMVLFLTTVGKSGTHRVFAVLPDYDSVGESLIVDFDVKRPVSPV